MLEDVSNILNLGEIPNLFDKNKKLPIDETGKMEQKVWDDVLSNMRTTIKKNGKKPPADDLLVGDAFLNSCKEHFSIAQMMSPSGSTFREQVKAFPALVGCTTMDWFHPWPNDALQEVAEF